MNPTAFRHFHNVTKYVVRLTGIEPARIASLDPKSSASANSATGAYVSGDKGTTKREKNKIKQYLFFLPSASTLNRRLKVRLSERNAKEKAVFLFTAERKYLKPQVKG